MDKAAISEAVKEMNLAMKLDRAIVGVRFIFDANEYKEAEAKAVIGKMPYCVMVRTAMAGKSLKAAAKNFGCNGAARALGVVELDEMTLSGRFYDSLGLYKDLPTSKDVRRNAVFCEHKAYGVMVKPLEQYSEEPHVVMIVTDPYNGMRIIQGYTYAFGFNTAYRMSGNQAICSECTCVPFETNDINVSLLCAGTRFKAKWRDDEMAIGFPFNQFLSIVSGVCATLDLTEPNEKKAQIEARFSAAGRTPPVIHYNKNYYTVLNPR
jgi:uncharacterized protein (DUF169 family)